MGGSPAVEPLLFGTSTSEVNNSGRSVDSDDNVDFSSEDDDGDVDAVTVVDPAKAGEKKRKLCVLKLIDNKWKKWKGN